MRHGGAPCRPSRRRSVLALTGAALIAVSLGLPPPGVLRAEDTRAVASTSAETKLDPSPHPTGAPSPPDDPSPSARSHPSGAPPAWTPPPTPTPVPLPSLIATASAVPVTKLPVGVFRAAPYSLPRLAWRSLPYNSLGFLSTKLTAPGTDADGIPYKHVNGRLYYNPGTIAQQGCRYIDAYVRTGNPVYLDRAERRAHRLRHLGFRARGALWLGYWFSYPSEGLSAPWASALAQGGGLSFFVRLYRVTGDPADLATARALFLSFRMLGRSNKPWVAYVDASHYLRLEEYPGRRPAHVFNGANFGYFGVYDYAMLTGDPTAIKIARGHLTAMRKYAIRYRVPGGLSYYDLVHFTRTPHYHAVDTWQLGVLGRMGGGSYFTRLKTLFHADYPWATYP